MAVPDFIAVSVGIGAVGGPAVQVTIPEEAPVGARLLLGFTGGPGAPSGDPAGWERLRSNTTPTNSTGHTWLWTAVATEDGASDPGSNVIIPLSGNARSVAVCAAYEASEVLASGLDESNPNARNAVSTPTAIAEVECRVVHGYGTISNAALTGDQVASWTPHASTTERADIGSTQNLAATGRQATLMIADEALPAPGTSPSRQATATTTGSDTRVQSQPWVVLLGVVASRPVAVAATSTPTVIVGATAELEGSATDGGGAGGPYTWQWDFASTPGTPPAITGATSQNATFEPDAPGEYVARLVVTDSDDVDSLPSTVAITVLGGSDTAFPISDIVVDGWTPSTGSEVFPLLADSTDATYVTSAENPTDQPLRCGLSPINESAPGDLLGLSARVSRENASAASAVLTLMEGTSTVIATSGPVAIAAGNVQQIDLVLAPAEIESITDETALRGHLTVTATD